MSKKFAIPRGTSDILPDEIQRWRAIENRARELFSIYGYHEIRTPHFEETELFARSIGQATDVVRKQMLTLNSQAQGEAADVKNAYYALRPEGTAAIVRSYVQHNFDKKENLSKLFYIGPMFRGERPQKGRLRQFHQIGAEAIGPSSASPLLDAEVIALSVNFLKHLGLNGFKLKLNTLGSVKDKEQFSEILRKALKAEVNSLCDDCQKRLSRNVFRVLDCKNRSCREVVGALNVGDEYLSGESKSYYRQVQQALEILNIEFEHSPHLVRGLDYYTHTVFEITDKALGSQDALGAGGRYSNLVSQLGGPAVDAIGFALGIERILLAMPPGDAKHGKGLTAYCLALDEDSLPMAYEILAHLRGEGITSDLNYRVSSVKSQMRIANKSAAKFVILLGEDERKKGSVTLKNMECGDQHTISIKNGNYEKLIGLLKGKV